MHFTDRFLDPPREFTPVPFWFLNEKLDTQRLNWQLRQMHEQHVFGAVMHPRPGLVDAYLSEDWFAHIGSILRTAQELNMFTWMYDEYPWMSGMAEWRVPKIHDDFRIRALDRLERTVDGPAEFTWSFQDELPENAGAVVAVLRAPVYPDGSTGSGELLRQDDGAVRTHVPPGTHLVGVYYERYSHSPYAGPYGKEAVTDLMHPAAVRAFIELTHREYERRFPEHVGTTIRATFTDEPPSNTPGWSRVLPEEFRLRKGYDLLSRLPALWRPGDRRAGQVRLDYADVVSQLYEEHFFGPLETWAEHAGVVSTGHVLLEETLPLHARFMGDYFRSLRRLHYPGIDYIFPGEIPAVTCKLAASVARLAGRDRVMSECFALTGWDFQPAHMKWMTDWQIVNGVDLLVPHAFSYATNEEEPIPPMRENLGFRWFDCPPSMFFQQPYWDSYHVYADYLRRLCYMVTRGRHECAIALYYPIETVQASYIPRCEHCDLSVGEIPGTWMTPSYQWDGTPMEQTDAHFRWIGNALRKHGFDYDVVDDDSLRDATVRDGWLFTDAGTSYSTVILPRSEWIHHDVYATLASFHEAGGTLVATGCTPRFACEGPERDFAVRRTSRRLFGHLATGNAAQNDEGRVGRSRYKEKAEDGGTAEEVRRASVFQRPGDELLQRLRGAGLADFMTDTPNVFAQHRRVGRGDLYFVVNHDRYHGSQCRLWFRGNGAPVVMDPLDGAIRQPARWRREGDRVLLQTYLEGNESLFVLIAPVAELPPTTGTRVEADELIVAREIPGPWRLVIDPGDTHPSRVRDLPPLPRFEDLPHERTVSPLRRWEELGLPAFSGGGTYEVAFTFQVASREGDLYIDLGEVGVAAELFLNDRSCGRRMWPPYRYLVTGAVRDGENRLRVRVTNTLANAIQESYGTGAAPTEAADWQVQQYARFTDERLRSGLMGPVRLLTFRPARKRGQ